MRVVETVAEMKQARRKICGSVGLVPTMGYLHEGHLSLARRAREENDVVVATIFVNPTQFGPHEDFERYPRNPERDHALLAREGADIVFTPPVQEIYPAGYDTYVEVGGVTDRLEGAVRPGHFRGVATVVAKLFNIVQPTKAYFGQKDAQQVVVIKKLVADLNMNLELEIMPTVREKGGLAMSSRNSYLSPEERQAALVLYRSLQLAQDMWDSGEKDAEKVRQAMTALISAERLAKIDYVSIADAISLAELVTINRPALVSLAVRIGKTRLIDNIAIQ